jgi:hypothetical protein
MKYIEEIPSFEEMSDVREDIKLLLNCLTELSRANDITEPCSRIAFIRDAARVLVEKSNEIVITIDKLCVGSD